MSDSIGHFLMVALNYAVAIWIGMLAVLFVRGVVSWFTGRDEDEDQGLDDCERPPAGTPCPRCGAPILQSEPVARVATRPLDPDQERLAVRGLLHVSEMVVIHRRCHRG